MSTRALRTMTGIAAGAWLVVVACGLGEAMAGDGDGNWETWYTIFTVALVLGVTLTALVVAGLTEVAQRPRLRTAGLAVAALGGVASVVGAWALPLWMALLGGGFAMVAAAVPGRRRPLALLAGGQLAGIVVLIAGIEAQVGRRNEWGDYPLAAGIALGVVAVATIAALVGLVAEPRRAVTPSPSGA